MTYQQQQLDLKLKPRRQRATEEEASWWFDQMRKQCDGPGPRPPHVRLLSRGLAERRGFQS